MHRSLNGGVFFKPMHSRTHTLANVCAYIHIDKHTQCVDVSTRIVRESDQWREMKRDAVSAPAGKEGGDVVDVRWDGRNSGGFTSND